jgi:heat shock protein HtpX
MPDTAQEAPQATSCPRCRRELTELRTVRWCPQCEWNLDRFNADRHDRPFGWRWADRLAFRAAYRLNARQFAALAGGDLTVTRARAARASVIAISAVLLAVTLAMFASGILLIVVDFPSLAIVPGALLVVISILLRPRFGRVDPLLRRLTPEQAPTLFRLIEQVATATDAPVPHIVAFDRHFNASAGAVGLRRRRVLTLGLPLWAVLPPPQRVALLGHELGHFVNGDVRRGPLTQLAFTTVGTVAALTRPDPRDLDEAAGFGVLTAYLTHALMSTVSGVLTAIQVVLLTIALRDAQRAEYLADERAGDVAGSAGIRELLDRMVNLPLVDSVIARAARTTGEVAEWRAAADASHQRLAKDITLSHQLSTSDRASLFASHPPTGLRRRMVESKPWRDAKVILTEEESDRIDAELSTLYARVRRDIGASLG